MRSTNDILIDVKDNKDVSKEELKMALLVLDSINFFNHNHLKRLLKGGLGAELTKKEFPDACADLGISKLEFEGLKKDPYEFLGSDHVPGTKEWEVIHKAATNVFNKVVNNL